MKARRRSCRHCSEIFAAGAIARLLRRRTIATMEELKVALGSSVDMTVFRKLRELSYLASYSHRGKYYALEDAAHFDERGLWAYRGVRFSRFGSLVDTLESFVARATRASLASELASELGVEVKQPLLGLVRAGRLAREDSAGLFLYCAADSGRRREQLLIRKLPAPESPAFAPLHELDSDSNEAKAAVVLFMSLLDEQQRRLFAGSLRRSATSPTTKRHAGSRTHSRTTTRARGPLAGRLVEYADRKCPFTMTITGPAARRAPKGLSSIGELPYIR